MKNPGICRMRGWLNQKVLLIAAFLLLFCAGSVSWASGGAHDEASKSETHGEVAEAHGDGETHGTKGWIATDTYRVMNFVVLFSALFLALRKPAARAMNARIEGIKEQLSDLEAKKVSAEKELAEYNKKIAQLDDEAKKIVAEYEKQGQDSRDRILKEAEAGAEKLKDQARKNIEYEFKQAKIKLQADVLEKAMAKAEDMLKAKITNEDQDRLVDEYLEKVVA